MARSNTLSFSSTVVAAKVAAFTTTRKGADRMSDAVTMLDARYEEETQTIKIFSSDGKLRECRIERLPSKEHAKALWKTIQSAGKAKTPVKFVAAGGFSPDRWFYQIVAE
jgi:hypothetical protein